MSNTHLRGVSHVIPLCVHVRVCVLPSVRMCTLVVLLTQPRLHHLLHPDGVGVAGSHREAFLIREGHAVLVVDDYADPGAASRCAAAALVGLAVQHQVQTWRVDI